jgi:hypothetical protein
VVANPTVVTAAFGAALLEIGVKATEAAAETDKAMRQIAASVPTASVGIEELSQQLDAIAIKAGKTTQEIEAAAVQAAQHGAASAEEVAQIVQAATTFSGATGTSIAASVDLIQQLIREFHLSGDEALRTLANLANVAQSAHVPVDELTSTFAGASPVFLKFGIDADTGTRAIVALVSAGFGVRQVRQELGKLDGAGIRALAAQVPEATGQLEKLNTRAAITEGSLDAVETRIRTKLNVQLKEFGNQLLPARLSLERFASDGLGAVLTALDKLNDRKSILETLAQSTGSPLLGLIAGFAGQAKTTPPKLTIEHEAPPFPIAPPKIAVPLGIAEQKQIADDLAFAQKALSEFSLSTQKALAGGTKSAVDNALADLQEFKNKYVSLRAEIEAKIKALPVNTPAADRSALTNILTQAAAADEAGVKARLANIDRIAQEEADKIRATVGTALSAMTGNLGEQAAAAIAEEAKQLIVQIGLTDNLSAAEKKRYIDAIALLGKYKLAAKESADEVAIANQRIADVQSHDPSTRDRLADQTRLQASLFGIEAEQRKLVLIGGEQVKNGDQYRQNQEKISALQKELNVLYKEGVKPNQQVADSIAKQLQDTAEHVRAIREAVDGALQLAGAFHLVDQNTLNVLRSVEPRSPRASPASSRS